MRRLALARNRIPRGVFGYNSTEWISERVGDGEFEIRAIQPPRLKRFAQARRDPCQKSRILRTITLRSIVDEYIADYRDAARREMEFYDSRHQRSLRHAVRIAALSKMADGKRHPHQRRLPSRVLESAAEALAGVDFRSSETFADLHGLVERTVAGIKGIGDLAIYDIAQRIGSYLELPPDAVYLHAGTRRGARALLGPTDRVLPLAVFPKDLRSLTAAELEDCLCIYKEDFATYRDGKQKYGFPMPR